jgi:cyanophycin synthetase
LEKAAGTVIDFELAPDLKRFYAGIDNAHDLLKLSAGNLVDQMFPEPDKARIPLVAVTGTNGKTTTSRMISHVFQKSGYKPGLVCSDGIFLDQQQVSKGDASAFIGHARALASTQIDAAILETHHRGIAVRGFAFEHCNIAVCLNVTGDHLIKGEIETLDEMTTIKRALLERAEDGAVLNADDPQCRTMLPFLKASRLCLFSSGQSRDEVAASVENPVVYCLVEQRENVAWVVICDGDESHAVLPVAGMPCTFAGAARFNLENALAAISACYLAGLPLASIASAMRSFEMGYENTPGRLNYYENLPFTAIIDYAHNPDGIARLSEFAAALPVKGRRLIMLAGPGDRSDEGIRDMARAAAGKFDHYVCRHYTNTRGRCEEEVPELLRSTFLKAGVADKAISVETDSAGAIDHILGMAEPSDLVILTVDHKEFEATNMRLIAMQQGRI